MLLNCIYFSHQQCTSSYHLKENLPTVFQNSAHAEKNDPPKITTTDDISLNKFGRSFSRVMLFRIVGHYA